MAELKQISIFAENRPGQLEEVTRVLAAQKFTILALDISSGDGYGVMRLIVDHNDAALAALKEAGFTCRTNEVIAVAMDDRPGGLLDLAAAFHKAGVNIENAYVLIPERREQAYLVCEVKDPAAAKEKLAAEKLAYFQP